MYSPGVSRWQDVSGACEMHVLDESLRTAALYLAWSVTRESG